jgi:hypothetical protein
MQTWASTPLYSSEGEGDEGDEGNMSNEDDESLLA